MELREIYETYVQKVAKVMDNASAFDGFWGWGDDPKKDPCHMEFYEAVETYLQALLKQPSEDVLFDAADRDRKSTRLNSSHLPRSRMPSSA